MTAALFNHAAFYLSSYKIAEMRRELERIDNASAIVEFPWRDDAWTLSLSDHDVSRVP